MGEFVSQRHTTDNFKKIQSNSNIINRQSREAWLAAGAKDITTVAYEKAIDIIENYKPDPLTDEQAAYVRKIIEDAEVEYGVK